MIAGYVFANSDLQRESINMYYEKPLTCPAMPTEQMGEASWRTANAVTMVLAAVGILLAMTFSRPWGNGSQLG